MRRLKRFIPARLLTTLGRKRRALIRHRLLAGLPRHSTGAEIGVYEGDLSAEIIAIVRPARLHLIDPWAYQPDPAYTEARYGAATQHGALVQSQMEARYERVRARFAIETGAGQVIIHRALSQDIAATFDDAYFDWVYIDGNHLYEFVLRDLELYYPKVKSGGALLGDDYNIVGWWEDGVTRAVDAFVAAHGLDLTVTGAQFHIRRP
jgi:hypothetical protein